MKMSPPPWRLRQTDVLPPPGMKMVTAPTVHADGHATADPVVGSTQWVLFARSPLGGVADGGSEFGRPAAIGRFWMSGGAAPVQAVLIVVKKLVPVSWQKVNPLQLAFVAM